MKIKYYDESDPTPEIEMCENCCCINEAGKDRCLHCNDLLKTGVKKRIKEIWIEIFNKFYTPVFTFTFRDHLRDCFGWVPCPDLRKIISSETNLWQVYAAAVFVITWLSALFLIFVVTP